MVAGRRSSGVEEDPIATAVPSAPEDSTPFSTVVAFQLFRLLSLKALSSEEEAPIDRFP